MKKQRNRYAKVLRQMVKAGEIQPPFNHLPAEGPLPNLPQTAYFAKNEIERLFDDHKNMWYTKKVLYNFKND